MKTCKYFDEAIKKQGLKNDTELAKELGIGKAALSHYRKGIRSVDNETCLKVAKMCGMDNPLPVIMAADADRAERSGQRSLWEEYFPKMAAASVTIFVTSPALAALYNKALAAAHFALCQIRRVSVPTKAEA